MPAILALDTSNELASVALLRGDALFVRTSSGVQTHSATVLPMVAEVLAEAGLTLADCAAVAYGPGPGSFTGVRTACGIAQGLAYGAGLPVIPVITLLAMAEACRAAHGATDVLAVLDARMGEVYWAQYHFDAATGWREVLAPALGAPGEVAPQGAHPGAVQACGNGFAAYAEAFAGKDFAAGADASIMPHAAQVAQLARLALQRGETLAPEQAQPLYLRNKVALTTREREQRQRESA